MGVRSRAAWQTAACAEGGLRGQCSGRGGGGAAAARECGDWCSGGAATVAAAAVASIDSLFVDAEFVDRLATTQRAIFRRPIRLPGRDGYQPRPGQRVILTGQTL